MAVFNGVFEAMRARGAVPVSTNPYVNDVTAPRQ